MRYNKWVAVLGLILIPLILVSCLSRQPEQGKTTENDGTSDNTGAVTQGNNENTSGNTEGDNEGKMITLCKNAKTNYRIIVKTVNQNDSTQITSFADALSKKTGTAFPLQNNGTTTYEQEILIGKVDRPVSQTAYEKLFYSDYSVTFSDGRICVSYYETDALKKALNLFLQSVRQNSEDGSWEIPENLNLTGSLSAVSENIPKSKSGETFLTSVISGGAGNRMATFNRFTRSAYNEYLDSLQANGFSRKFSNDISGNLFSIYTKGSCQVNLYWYPSKQIFKLIYGPLGYLPETEQPTITPVCTPSVTQLGRKAADESAPNGAPGMSYVIQTSDGHFIIVDGGPLDQNRDDETALLNFLLSKKPATDEKPVISAWFFTHAHIDHTQLAAQFFKDHAKEVVIETIAYQFPDFNAITMTEQVSGLQVVEQQLMASVKNNLPGVKTLTLHTGMAFYLGDAKVEILFTPENHAPEKFPTGNHTSIAFRILLGGKTVMLLGDSERSNCQFLADVFGTNLKSDILQVSHHGVNGACLDLYQKIDPAICFWAIDEGRFQNHTQIRGSSAWDFNKWILDSSIRVREHYSTSTTITIPLS